MVNKPRTAQSTTSRHKNLSNSVMNTTMLSFFHNVSIFYSWFLFQRFFSKKPRNQKLFKLTSTPRFLLIPIITRLTPEFIEPATKTRLAITLKDTAHTASVSNRSPIQEIVASPRSGWKQILKESGRPFLCAVNAMLRPTKLNAAHL